MVYILGKCCSEIARTIDGGKDGGREGGIKGERKKGRRGGGVGVKPVFLDLQNITKCNS